MRNSNLIQMGRRRSETGPFQFMVMLRTICYDPPLNIVPPGGKMWHTSFCSMKTFHTEKNIKQDRICLCLWAAPWPGLQTQLYVSKSSNLVWDTRQRISFGPVHKLVHSHDGSTFTFEFKDRNNANSLYQFKPGTADAICAKSFGFIW